ncbi:MAG: chromosomal replication initiator protein DnaA [bacterium]
MQSIWNNALKAIEVKMSSRNFDLWIRPLQFVKLTDNTLTLMAPNPYLREWFEDNYLKSVQSEIFTQIGKDIQVQVIVDDTPEATPQLASVRPEPVAQRIHRQVSSGQATLNERYRFDNFVVGPSNQFAQAAAELVADIPGTKYNPLFIYGGTGLGKTHLLHAIGHALADRNPEWNITCITAERFMNEFINCLRQGKMEEYRDRYRSYCDVLLVDDIQFMAGKDHTQQEFFHTFNALHDKKKQIVITSDKFPNQMPELEERLKSRFQWGLIVDILAPELETRVAILKMKAELDSIPLPDDVAHFLASRIRSNVRELEGALIRLAAFSSLQGRPITVEFAERILSNMLTRGTGQISIERIQREVSTYFNIRTKDLKSSRRPRAISYPRQIAMHLCRKLTPASLSEIGRQFGGKDHTTVLSADKKMQLLVTEDDTTRQAVEALERILTG